MRQVDPPNRKIKREDIISLRRKLRDGPSFSSDNEELNNRLFGMLSDFPLVEVPREDVFGPPRFPIFELPYEYIWAYERRFRYTHIDEDFDWWIEPGHEIKEGMFENPDGTVLVEERPNYVGSFEEAERLRRRMLKNTLMHLKQVELGEEDGLMSCGWSVSITDLNGKELSHEEAEEAPRTIVTGVLSVLLEYPECAHGIDIIE